MSEPIPDGSISGKVLQFTPPSIPTIRQLGSAAFMQQLYEQPHNPSMDTPSRHELDAKLDAIEARMDARVAGMSAKLDTALAEMRADRDSHNIRFSRMESDLQGVVSAMSTMSADVERKLTAVSVQTSEQVKGLKSNIWYGVATTIAAVGATLAIAISSFDSGRETSKSIAEATAQMKQLQMQLEAQAKAAASAPATTAPAPSIPPASQQ